MSCQNSKNLLAILFTELKNILHKQENLLNRPMPVILISSRLVVASYINNTLYNIIYNYIYQRHI